MKNRFFLAFAIIVVVAFAGFLYMAWPYRGLVPNIVPVPTAVPSPTPSSTAGVVQGSNTTGLPLKLPEGFSMNVFAKGLVNPRVLQFDPFGDLTVSIPSEGKIASLPDADENGVADKTVGVLDKLSRPHGFLFYSNAANNRKYLAVAEAEKLMIYGFGSDSKLQPVAYDGQKAFDLPSSGRHWTKTLLRLNESSAEELDPPILVSIGSSCDVCHESDPRRGAIYSFDPFAEKKELVPYAKGLRNSVFLVKGPDENVWATEMGRDFLGDELPPDEINIIEKDKNYGWPVCYGKNIHDTQFDKNTYIRNPCMEPLETQSKIDLPAHSAPLGLAFIPAGRGWPEEYEGNLLVAFHGSWNRSEPTGYKVRRFVLDANGDVVNDEDFISGWLDDKGVLGRPVDLKFDNNGTLFISDDRSGVIYRVTPPKQ